MSSSASLVTEMSSETNERFFVRNLELPPLVHAVPSKEATDETLFIPGFAPDDPVLVGVQTRACCLGSVEPCARRDW